MQPNRQMHLNLFLSGDGHHEAAWRHPLANTAHSSTAQHYIDQARTAERALFDSVFLADSLCTFIDIRHSVPRNFEPVSLLAAIATATTHIGLIGTMSTSYTEPYNLARYFASLDHLSGGRAGWNIVTTAEDRSAENFGRTANIEHSQRYERADEFVDVVKQLWDSWAEDYALANKSAGVYADPGKVREINHAGRHFRVRGPLNIVRSPQGYPLLVQAGSSPTGLEFAARHAEVVFTVQQTLDGARTFYRSLKQQAAAHGRNPQKIKILPGIVPIVGKTSADAQNRARELDELIVPERAVTALGDRLGLDLSSHPLDEPLPEVPSANLFSGQQGRYKVIKDLIDQGKPTLRQLLSVLGSGRGHRTVIGDPREIADCMEEWFSDGAADGFTVMPALLPEGLTLFAEQVVPELRARGLTRSAYTGSLLRDHYGQARPAITA